MPKTCISNVISVFLDHLKPKIFYTGQPWWPTRSAPPFSKSLDPPLMIIINTSQQNFEDEKSCGEFIFSTITYNKNNFTLVHKHHKNFQKRFQKFKTTLTHYFINQRSYLHISPIIQQKHLLVTIS